MGNSSDNQYPLRRDNTQGKNKFNFKPPTPPSHFLSLKPQPSSTDLHTKVRAEAKEMVRNNKTSYSQALQSLLKDPSKLGADVNDARFEISRIMYNNRKLSEYKTAVDKKIHEKVRS